MLYNPSKSNWLNPNIEYLFNTDIKEYDVRNGGFSIIKEYGLLPPLKIKELSALGKQEQHIAIGILQRENKELSKSLLSKFADIRLIFINANQLTDNDIISVKKDAIFTSKNCNKLKFGQIEFVSKNSYTSYIRFTDNMNIEIYYDQSNFDVKGIGESSINMHRLFMLDFINSIISYLETKNNYVKRFLKQFIDKYKQMKLDEEYYVEFNNRSRDYNPMYNFQKVLVPLTQIVLREIE